MAENAAQSDNAFVNLAPDYENNKGPHKNAYLNSVWGGTSNMPGWGISAGVSGAYKSLVADQESGEPTDAGYEELKGRLDKITNTLENYGEEIADLRGYTEDEIEEIYEAFDKYADQIDNRLDDFEHEIEDLRSVTEEDRRSWIKDLEDSDKWKDNFDGQHEDYIDVANSVLESDIPEEDKADVIYTALSLSGIPTKGVRDVYFGSHQGYTEHKMKNLQNND